MRPHAAADPAAMDRFVGSAAPIQRLDPRTVRPCDATVVDDLYFITHNDQDGRARLSRRVLGLGLAGGLLAELVLFGNLSVEDGQLWLVSTDPPADRVAQTVVAHIAHGSQYRDVRTWLSYLGEHAVNMVVNRLVDRRLLVPTQTRGLLRTQTVFVPVDRNDAVWREVRISEALTTPRSMTVREITIAGLVMACGLIKQVLWQPENFDFGMANLTHMEGQLPAALRELVAETEAAVGDAVLAPR